MCFLRKKKVKKNCFALKKNIYRTARLGPDVRGAADWRICRGRGVITPLIEAMITNFVHVNITRHPGSGCGIRNGYIKCGWARFSLDISSSKCHAER